MALVGIDIGTKTVGVAFSDGSVVVPIGAFARAKGNAEREVLRVLEERQCLTVVAGLPLSYEGEETEFCENVRNFCRRLTRRMPSIQIRYVDELLSSNEAEERLGVSSRNRSRLKDGGMIDSMSACIVLERFLKSGALPD